MIVRKKATGDDLLELVARPGVEGCEIVSAENAHTLNDWDYIYSFVDVYGRVWGVAGALEFRPGKWELFLIVDPEAKGHLIGIVKSALEFVQNFGKDLEAEVEKGFIQGHKLVLMLGFKEKAPRDVEAQSHREGPEFVRYIRFHKGETKGD